jgi:hypothetical protein
MLRRVDWQPVNEISGQPVRSTFKGQAVQADARFGTHMASRNFGNYQSTMRNTSEDRRP